MEDIQKLDNHLTSAAAFVEGGIQDANDDSCSICLEEFSSSDPSTVTSCKHEFHLQCILEWCQRSSQCPMCWQAISLKDSASQELVQAVEGKGPLVLLHQEIPPYFAVLLLLPVGVNDPELEERIIRHLAAAMGRSHHTGMREVQRRSSSHGHPHYMVQNTSASGTTISPVNRRRISFNNRSTSGDSSLTNQAEAGPSEFQSFSESLKLRLNAVSLRYKESISKSKRSWKERLFSRNSSMSDIGNEVHREVSAGIASVSRVMERLEINGNSRENQVSVFHHSVESHVTEQGNQHNTGMNRDNPLTIVPSRPPHATSSLST